MTENEQLNKQVEQYYQKQKDNMFREEREKKAKAQAEYAMLMPPVNDRTDTGQAERFIKYANGCIAYNHQWGWSCYTQTADGGGVWVDSEESVVNLYLQFTNAQRVALVDSGIMNDEATAQEGETASKFIRHYRSAAAIRAVLMIAANKAYTQPEQWDNNPYLLNAQNGVIDLKTGDLLNAAPHYHMRKICACKYLKTPNGADMWQATLDRIIIDDNGKPDIELQCYLNGIGGFAALGKSYEVLYMCYSNGGSGKSTMWDTIAHTLGNYAVIVPPDLLVCDERRGDNSAARFMIDGLNGARLALMSETDDGQMLSAKQLKLLTANHKISAEQKHKARYEFTPTHTLVMHTNNIPRIHAKDDGVWDRLKIIPYRARIRNTPDDDKQYRDKLKAQADEAVLKWLVDGAICITGIGERLDEPDSVRTIVEKQRGADAIPDSIKAFLDDCCSVDGNGLSVKTTSLYSQYAHYTTQNGFDTVSSLKFKKVLLEYCGVTYRNTNQGSYYYGIELIH